MKVRPWAAAALLLSGIWLNAWAVWGRDWLQARIWSDLPTLAAVVASCWAILMAGLLAARRDEPKEA